MKGAYKGSSSECRKKALACSATKKTTVALSFKGKASSVLKKRNF